MGSAADPRRPPVGRILAGVVLIGYPALVWFGLTHWSPRRLALVLLCVLLPAAALRLRGAPRAGLRGLAAVPLVTVCALALAALLDASGYVLLVPVAINAVLLAGFGWTLRPGAMPMIERMARLRVQDLSGAKRAWCHLWTQIWCGFFVVNGALAFGLARTASLAAWALYNGLVAYVLMGVLFATEWTLRRRRFGPGPGGRGDDVRRADARPPEARVGGAGPGGLRGAHDGERARPGAR
jgi:uncharacterized membrane protein